MASYAWLLYRVGASSLASDTIVATSPLITSLSDLQNQVVTYNLLFRRWPRLEIDRIVSEITTTLAAADNECYVNIAELYELMSLVSLG